jgi:hypothetical protein
MARVATLFHRFVNSCTAQQIRVALKAGQGRNRGRGVGVVTFLAPVFFHGRVAVLTCSDLPVATPAVALQASFQQAGALGGMGVVTLCTVVTVLLFIVPAARFTLVASGTEPWGGLFDQALYRGGMGVMTREALPIFNRYVDMAFT